MKEIKAFETTDGRVFTDYDEAYEYETAYLVKRAIREVVDMEGYNGMSKDDIAHLIFENENAIREAYDVTPVDKS